MLILTSRVAESVLTSIPGYDEQLESTRYAGRLPGQINPGIAAPQNVVILREELLDSGKA